jgi:hypothetical protein
LRFAARAFLLAQTSSGGSMGMRPGNRWTVVSGQWTAKTSHPCAFLIFLIGLVTVAAAPSAWAAPEDAAAEAAQVQTPEAADMTLDHLRQAIAAETDPELRREMEEQLGLFESGQLDLTGRELALGAPTEAPGATGANTLPTEGILPGTGPVPGGGQLGAPDVIGPPVEDQANMPEYMTPALREQLFNVYDQVSAGTLSEQEARTQAETILQEHGIDPREIGPGHEGEGEHEGLGGPREDGGYGLDRAWEQMSPEAREQLEQLHGGEHDEHAPEVFRELFEREGLELGAPREYEGHEAQRLEFDAPMREFETPMREFEASGREYEAAGHEMEAPTREFEAAMREYEAPTHEYEAPTREFEAAVREYEAPAREYEAPTHEYEAPTREYEAPTHEVEAPVREYEAPTYEAPTREYEAPTYEAPTHEYEAPEMPSQEMQHESEYQAPQPPQ